MSNKKLKVDFTGVEEFVRCAVGQHKAKVVEAEEKVSQNGNDMISVSFEVLAGESKGAKVYDNFPLTEKALWKLKTFLITLGMKADGKVLLDLSKLPGKTLIIDVTEEEYDGKTRAKIQSYKKLEAEAPKKVLPESPDVDEDDEWEE